MIDLEFNLLNDFQRDFPLAPAPFAELAHRLGVTETEVLATLNHLQACGKISRVGAVFKPHTIGSSTLAALAVPADEIEAVAQLVNSYPEVNHNYEREHEYNLWFVLTAATEERIQTILEDIRCRIGYQPLYLPMVDDFHIDLGFDLSNPNSPFPAGQKTPAQPRTLTEWQPLSQLQEKALIGAIQKGFPLVTRPFLEIGTGIGLSEKEVLSGLTHLIARGTIKRLGVVVRHRELGYRANAMVVWDIPNEQIKTLGHRIGHSGEVTLCYSRPRRLPAWRYNLFTMIHGQHANEVLQRVALLKEKHGLQDTACAVLFSRRCFKQCGAQYLSNPQTAAHRVQSDTLTEMV